MNRTKEIWVTSIFEVFEKMFYIFLEQVEIRGHYDMIAEISFKGPRRGGMRFYFPDSFSRTMAANMLNLEPDEITQTVMEDCLKESANMICGNFLHKFDAGRTFDLGLPRLAREAGDIQAAADSDRLISAAFESDGEGFFCELTFESEDAAR